MPAISRIEKADNTYFAKRETNMRINLKCYFSMVAFKEANWKFSKSELCNSSPEAKTEENCEIFRSDLSYSSMVAFKMRKTDEPSNLNCVMILYTEGKKRKFCEIWLIFISTMFQPYGGYKRRKIDEFKNLEYVTALWWH